MLDAEEWDSDDAVELTEARNTPNGMGGCVVVVELFRGSTTWRLAAGAICSEDVYFVCTSYSTVIRRLSVCSPLFSKAKTVSQIQTAAFCQGQ